MVFENDLAGIVSTQVVAGTLNNVLSKTCQLTAYVLSKYTTTSVDVRAPNVMYWLQKFVEKKCGKRLGHYRRDKNIVIRRNNVLGIQKKLDPITTEFSVFFWYKGTLIRIIRIITVTAVTPYKMIEKMIVTAYGIRKRQLLCEIIAEAESMADQRPEGTICYYRADAEAYRWKGTRKTKARSLSSVILCKGVAQAIRQDIEEFLESREWYTTIGIPYRRGYLLYGPPGCGKTSFVKGIAGQIGYNIWELPLSSRKLTDGMLNEFIKTIGKKSILLLEDIDSAFAARIQDEERAGEEDVHLGKLSIREARSNITFSALLNAIDGAASEEDYIIFMTTNHIERLDTALIRPGRVDFKQLIDYPNEEQIEAFTKQLYTDCNPEIASEFVKAVKNLKCYPSMAQIQGLFLKHKNEPDALVGDIQTLVEMSKNNVDLSHRNFYT